MPQNAELVLQIIRDHAQRLQRVDIYCPRPEKASICQKRAFAGATFLGGRTVFVRVAVRGCARQLGRYDAWIVSKTVIEFGTVPTFACDDGVLHIWSPLLNVRVRFDPEPYAEECALTGRWAEAWPEFRLLVPKSKWRLQEPMKAKKKSFEAFRETVPQALCKIVEPFGSHQWMLLQFINESAAGRELAETNPVLAYALANSYELRRTNPKAAAFQAHAHSRDKQRDLCKWMKFPGTPAMVRLFKRIRPDSICPSMLRQLRHAMGQDEKRLMKFLGHRQHIHADSLYFIIFPKLMALTTQKLLDDIDGRDGKVLFSTIADQVLHALRLLKRIKSKRDVRPFESLRQIHNFVGAVDNEYLEWQQRMEDEHRERLNALANAERVRSAARRRSAAETKGKNLDPKTCEWPPPPIPGNEHIVPITSYAMLCQESATQINCIRTYWQNIASKSFSVYAYRLLEPVRATFTLVRRSGNTWYLSQIETKGNRRVSERTRCVVEKWLYSYTLSASMRP